MKRLLVVALFAVGLSSIARAQEGVTATSRDAASNVAADFSKTSAANGRLLPFDNGIPALETATNVNFFGATRYATPGGSSSLAALVAAPSPVSAADPAPASPSPRFVYGGRDDYRWQLAVGVSVVRFRSSVFFATAVGPDTVLTYFTNEWFAIEGSVTAAFAPAIFLNEHVRFLGYNIGPKIAWRQRKWEPWAHALFGGAHVVPQTSSGSQNGYAISLGGGTDYRINPRFALRLEVDYLRTGVMGQTQNSGQGMFGGVFHF
jgi:hypothetical protein